LKERIMIKDDTELRDDVVEELPLAKLAA